MSAGAQQQKSLQIALTFLTILTILSLLMVMKEKKRWTFPGEIMDFKTSQTDKGIFLIKALANVSESLDKVEAGIDGVAVRAAAVRIKLEQIDIQEKKAFIICALTKRLKENLRNYRQKSKVS